MDPVAMGNQGGGSIPVEKLADILESVNYPVLVLSDDRTISYVNQAGEQLIGRPARSMVGERAMLAAPEFFGKSFQHQLDSTRLCTASQYEEYYSPRDLWTEVHLCPSPVGILVCVRDITGRKRTERILTGQKRVLELVTSGATLQEILDAITSMVENQSARDLCTILLLGDDGKRLRLGSGGSVAGEYNAAIDGLEIGPGVGSCGTAAFTRCRVIASDIATDPNWAPYKYIALEHGLCACWSQPILSRDGSRVLGTIANYSRKSGEPSRQSLLLLSTAAHLAQIAIEADQAARERERIQSRLVAEAAVTRILATAANVEDAIPQLLEAIGSNSGWDLGGWWSVDERRQLLRCQHVWTAPSTALGEFAAATRALTLPVGAGLPGRVLESGQPAWTADASADPAFVRRAVALESGLHGGAAFPILQGGRITAVIDFLVSSIRQRDLQLDSMLTVIGGQIGQFIDRIRAQEQLLAARDAAEKANRAKDRFLATLSHELRTPLSPALLLATSMARDKRLSDQAREDMQLIQRSIELQTRLINDLLDLSRIENNKLTLQVRPINLHELILDSLRICNAEIGEKRIQISTELKADCDTLNADPARLRQVVCNLVKNATKFTPEGGAVSLSTADLPTGGVRTIVRDTGIGADAEMLQKMFEPFEQGGRMRESQGLGLGLTICKGLVEAHGGKISAASEGPGRGLSIVVDLPAAPDISVEVFARPENTPAAPTLLSAPDAIR
jgi:PAS domain S-box-containing protein